MSIVDKAEELIRLYNYDYITAFNEAKKLLQGEKANKVVDKTRKHKKNEILLNLDLESMIQEWVSIVKNTRLRDIALALALFPARPLSFLKCEVQGQENGYYIATHLIKNSSNLIIYPKELPVKLDMNYNTFKVYLARLYSKLFRKTIKYDPSYTKDIFRHAYAKFFYEKHRVDMHIIDAYLLQHAPRGNVSYYLTLNVKDFILNEFYPRMLKNDTYKMLYEEVVKDVS